MPCGKTGWSQTCDGADVPGGLLADDGHAAVNYWNFPRAAMGITVSTRP
jgi:hypothetical protein